MAGTTLTTAHRMAAQVLSYAPAHFSQGPEAYSTEMYPGYSNYQNYSSNQQQNFLPDTEHHNTAYTSSDGWTNQPSNLRRVSSRSPSNQHDRTPIRHQRQGYSRSRSTSRPEALLAYATEHSVQHHSTATTPSLAQTTPSSSPALFPSQTYSTISPASPYVQQPQYYSGASPQFSDMQGPPSARSHGMSDYYQMSRPDMQIPPLSGSNISPSNVLFMPTPNQASPVQISGLAARSLTYSSLPPTLESTPGGIEVSSSRNKPQCWDHGCNGRQFSTFSNLLRHQREKSGTAAKSRCPHCNTEFTRTTARNGHMYGGKCKGMPDSSRRSSSGGDENLEK